MRRSKYGNKRVVAADGLTFDSKREHARWLDLTLLERAGEIRELKRQVRYPLTVDGKPLRYPSGRIATYVADYTYWDVRRGKRVVEDAKGMRTDVYKLKRAIMAANGYDILET
jgi:hypothetical protein